MLRFAFNRSATLLLSPALLLATVVLAHLGCAAPAPDPANPTEEITPAPISAATPILERSRDVSQQLREAQRDRRQRMGQ